MTALFSAPKVPVSAPPTAPPPVAPVAAPARVSDTAAAEKARLAARRRAGGGIRSNILAPLGRSAGDTGAPVKSATLG